MTPRQSVFYRIQEVSNDIVLFFYVYAAVFFLISCLLLFFSTESLLGHYFHPSILAITHAMALGWGTMMILGASYQLIPVLVESSLPSTVLAKISFGLAALGIPCLVYGFYSFQLGRIAQAGGIAINLAVVAYVINLAWAVFKSESDNIHAIFVLTASCWLLVTTFWGLLLLFNFTVDLLPQDSLQYLSSHAHAGIVGWFLLLVIGVGSRLIPMFLISKYTNDKLLWLIFCLVNAALIWHILGELYIFFPDIPSLSIILIGLGILFFIYYCWNAYHHRIRRKTDKQVGLSLAAVGTTLIPLVIVGTLIQGKGPLSMDNTLVMAYGFCMFFGWITAIILGMTFKTLPFIIWSKLYSYQSSKLRKPDPKDLFNKGIFNGMVIFYGLGFVGVLAGLRWGSEPILKMATASLIFSAVLYVWNVLKVVLHQAKN